MEAAQNDPTKPSNALGSVGRVSAVVLGGALLTLTLILGAVGLRSITSVQHAILQAVLKAPESPYLDKLITSWSDLAVPLSFCLAAPAGLFLIASIMAFRGELTVTYKKRA